MPDMGALTITNVMGNKIGKEQLSKLQDIMRSKRNLISLCGIADDATEADLSGLTMDDDDAIILASELPDKGALSILNLAENTLGELVLPDGWDYYYKEEVYKHTDGREQKDSPCKREGIIAIANAIPDMRAMTKLDMSKNYFAGAAAGKAIGDMLTGNSTLKDLDLSGCHLDSYAVKGISKGLAGNVALYELILKDNKLATAEAGDALGEALEGNTVLKELDISGNYWDNTAYGHDKSDGPGFAKGISKGLSGNGAMTSLNLASNAIGSEGAKHVAEAIHVSVLLRLFWYQCDAHLTSGSTAVVCHCPQDMGALSSLNLSSCGLTRGTLKGDPRDNFDKKYGDKWGSKDEHYESDMHLLPLPLPSPI
jgi:hypothetical protein